MDATQLFNDIITDNTSGSGELLSQLKAKVKSYLESSNPNPGKLVKELQKVAEELKDFAVIIHFIYHFTKKVESDPSISSLKNFMDEYEKKWNVTGLIRKFYRDVCLAGKTILVHSNSSTVKSVLEHMDEPGNCRIIQTFSSPAGEGIKQGAFLTDKGFDVTMIHENNAWNFAGTIDCFLFGADRVETGRFMNKAGTAHLCLLARYLSLPVYVVADPRKKVEPSYYDFLKLKFPEQPSDNNSSELMQAVPEGMEIRNPYFEWIPLKLVTDVYS
ncbi:MAG: hypothetical protein K9I68_00920 [Bacteroidales bacterium]|nr:hypothetical protein [Bacteroidales bacterium]MCF8336906.1 hypothetical protein [Bacteroidales bacterium]